MKGKDLLLGLVILGLLVWGLSLSGIDFSKLVSQKATGEVREEAITEETPEHVKETEKGVDVYAISSVNYKPTVTDALNETREPVSATFYIWQPGAVEPTSVSLSGGSGSVAVPPNSEITWSAGSDGSYYWEKGTTKIGWTDKPEDIKLYSVAGANDVSVRIFYNYQEQTDGANNATLGAGGSLTYQIQIDDTGLYTAVRRPHICVDYNTSVIKSVDIAGLTEVTSLPTRLIPTIDQCWDTGITYYTDSDPILNYDATVRALSGVDPTVNNSKICWYVIDQDMYYKDGQMYFVHPITMTNMGSTTNWSGCHYMA